MKDLETKKKILSEKFELLVIIFMSFFLVGKFSPTVKAEETILFPITREYKVKEDSPGIYIITSNDSKDKIDVINLFPSPLTNIQAQRIQKITNGKSRKILRGYEIFDTHGGYADKYFIINNKKSIEYHINDGRLVTIYEYLKHTDGKRLESYNF